MTATDLESVVRGRRAVRGFLPDPVPDEVMRAAFELAQHAPSNCNVQPWRVFVASGPARDRLRARLVQAMRSVTPSDTELPIDDFPGSIGGCRWRVR